MRRSILYICPVNPFPPDSGDKIRAANMIRLLAECFEVDIVTYESPARGGRRVQMLPDNCQVLTVSNVDGTRWGLYLRSLALRRINTQLSHCDLHLTPILKQLSAKKQFDYVVMAHSSFGHLIPLLRDVQPGAVMVIDAQNFESDLMQQRALAQSSLLKKSYYLLSSRWNRKLERVNCERADLLIFTSDSDAELFRALSPEHRHKVAMIPDFVDLNTNSSIEQEQLLLLYESDFVRSNLQRLFGA